MKLFLFNIFVNFIINFIMYFAMNFKSMEDHFINLIYLIKFVLFIRDLILMI